ncbi:MAG: hypothetical protein K2F84_06670, partial [Bacteroidales bacterium]|nr:hypothetical protein [Bacteroidales bacterium]
MKTIVKMIGGLLIGCLAGFAIGALCVVLFTDTTLSGFIAKCGTLELSEGLAVILVSIAAFLVSLFLLIMLHEAGHLAFGLMSGYRFVSFRILNLTFIKLDGHLRVKRFSVAGTGGQCLLTPPDKPLSEIPTFWYNAGGVAANLLALLLVAPLLCLELQPLMRTSLVIFCLTDLFLILTNGIPMRLGGIANDAHNALELSRNERSKHAMMLQLRTNALIQAGIRPKDMPAAWFETPADLNYQNAIEVSLPLMVASRLVDEMAWEDAYAAFDALYAHREQILPLYVKEIACELIFCALITGRTDRAQSLYTEDIKRYLAIYRKVMSSKERILCGIHLLLEHDR